VRARVQKWGNSLAVRIPKAIALEAGLRAQVEVDVSVENGNVVVAAIPDETYELSTLLADVTAENIHGEFGSGPSVGNESW